MGTISLTDAIAGTDMVASLIINNNTLLETEINGNLDNSNIKAAAGIVVSKLAGGTNGQVLTTVAGASAWATPATGFVFPAPATTLPGSPTDGQLAVLVDSTTNPTYQWVFRYNSSNSTSYKWEFIGGTLPTFDAQFMSGTEETTSSTTYVDLGTVGPQITVPVAGVYQLKLSCRIRHGGSGSGQNMYMSPKLGAAATADGDGVFGNGHQNATSYVFGYRQVTMTSAGLIKCQYRTANASYSANVANRQMSVTPLRLA